MTGGSFVIVIVITGANGAIGAALIRYLHRQANLPAETLRAVVRSAAGAVVTEKLPSKTFCLRYDDTDAMNAALRGADAVVHLAGALRPRRGETLYDANVATTRTVLAAMRAAAIRRLVYVSAPGADSNSPNDYLRSKGVAEEDVRAGGFSGAILRVPMVLGRDGPSLATLCRMATARLVPLVKGGAVKVQPIARDDLVAAIHWALTREERSLVTLGLVGPDTLTYVDLLRKVGKRVGKTPRVLPVPGSLVEASARVAAWVPALGWNWSLFDTLFNEHLADGAAAEAMLPFSLTHVDPLLDELLGAGR